MAGLVTKLMHWFLYMLIGWMQYKCKSWSWMLCFYQLCLQLTGTQSLSCERME